MRKIFFIFIVFLCGILLTVFASGGGGTPTCSQSGIARHISLAYVPTDFNYGTSGAPYSPPSTCHNTSNHQFASSSDNCVVYGVQPRDRLSWHPVAYEGNRPCNYSKSFSLTNGNRLTNYLCESFNGYSSGTWELKYPLGVAYKARIRWQIGCTLIYYSGTFSYSASKGTAETLYWYLENQAPNGFPHSFSNNTLVVKDWVGGYSCNLCN